MRKAIIGIAVATAMTWAAVAAAQPFDINLSTSAVGFNQPIGIDFHEPTGKLIMSVNYPSGLPNNLDLVDPVSGTRIQFSSLVGLVNELKVATVRASACQGGFAVGEVFTGNGTAGGIIRIDPSGAPLLNPWVVLPGPGTDLIRGSLFQDRFCAAGGDLIVVTGNEQSDPPQNTSTGNVWRVSSTATANCSSGCTLVGTTGTHLEGVTTVPNLPLVYGPLAGRILAGAEDVIVSGNTASYGTHGRIYAFNPNPPHDFFTIGAGTGPACNTLGQPAGCNFATVEIHPEDLDVIRRNAEFFGVNYNNFPNGRMLTAHAVDFDELCGQVLITRELPNSGGGGNPSGLSVLSWDSTNHTPLVEYLTSNENIQQWEHVTFTSGQDCATTITIAKTPDNGTFTIGQQITWTIVVTNTGTVTALGVQVTDPLPTTGGLTWGTTTTTAGTCSVVANQLSCNLGDILAGNSVTVTVTTNNPNGAPAAACTRIDNTATATSTNAATVSDPGDTTCTPNPNVTIKKFTNNADAQTPNDADVPNIAVGGAVTWRYEVKNTGNVPVAKADVVVTDDHTGVTPAPVMVGGFVSGDTNQNNFLDPNETWIYQATGTAMNLALTPLDPGKIVAGVCTHNNTEPPRNGYVNQGKVTIPGPISATDPSAYCNPPAPSITIKKFTNNADAQTPNDADVPNIAIGGAVTWRYEVKNTGNVSVAKADVVVTDDHTGVTPAPVMVGGFVSGDTNQNNFLDPNETWIYQATGTAMNLALTPLDPGKIVAGVCTHNNTEPPRNGYVNQGKVTIPGPISATDPSAYCNPPAPSITIKKFTNNADAQTPNDADVPNIAIGGAVTWRYEVKNTGNVPVAKANVVVTDDHTGVTPQPVMVGGFVSGDTNQNNFLDPNETWIYQATGTAMNLALTPLDPGKIVAGVCTHNNTEPPRNGYVNQGKVTIPGPISATDPSAYCNPPAPSITIKKFTNNADAQTPNDADVPNIAIGGAVTWRYEVKNTGNVPVAQANVVVTDDHTGVTPAPVMVGGFVSGDTNQNNFLDPNETWIYQATGTAMNLALTPLDPGKIVAGVCTHNNTEPPRNGYVNQGKVTIPGPISATDPSAYCNPPAPSITIKKFTNNADAQTPNDADVPNIAIGGAVTWRYEVKNTGNVPVAQANVVVTDDHTGVTPAPVMVGGFVSGDTNQNNFLDPNETWIYQATGTAMNLALTPLDPGKIVAGVCTHNNTEPPRNGYVNQGKVTIPGPISATDPSAYCNPPAPSITIKKFTNNADAQTPNDADVPNIPVGGTVTWTYRVTNTGNVPVAQANVVVTDDHTGVTPAPVMVGGFVSGDTNQNNFLDPNETWIYQATGTAMNLALTPLDPGKIVAGVCTHNNTEPPRNGYVNQGKVTIPGPISATDPSAYCNPPPGKSIEIGPSSMEGAIKIDIGDWVNGGYSFKTNFTGTITIAATVSITGPCTGGTLASDTLVVNLGTRTYNAVSGADWLPTGDANSVLSWQGSLIAPATLCGGGQLNASKGAVFDATISGVPAGKAVTFRFKFRDPAAKGKPNTNCLDTSDPNRNKADVCGASWSETKHDP